MVTNTKKQYSIFQYSLSSVDIIIVTMYYECVFTLVFTPGIIIIIITPGSNTLLVGIIMAPGCYVDENAYMLN